MKFLVVIDPNSFLARAYGEDLPKVRCEPQSCPAFVCSAIDMGHSWYMRVTTLPTEKCSGEQSLHIPHSAVLAVLEYDSGDPTPLGFV